MQRKGLMVIGLFGFMLLAAMPALAQDASPLSQETPEAPAGLPSLPADPQQQEPIETQDDSYATAISIGCGSWGLGYISYAGDTDYWKFTLPANDTIVARVWAMEGGSPLNSTLREFMDFGGTLGINELAYSDDIDGRDPRLHVTGTYYNTTNYLQVRDSGNNEGSGGHWYYVQWDRPTYMSAVAAGTVAGISYQPGDVLAYYQCSNTWELLFDASDVAVALNTKGFAMYPNVSTGRFLIIFAKKGNVPGVGTVMPHDVVEFVASDVGPDTAGFFRPFIDGSDVGLSTSGEKLDSIALDRFGYILLSTSGNGNIPGVGAIADEDIMRFIAGSYGNNTTGTWSMYYDGSDVGLGPSDINNVWQSPAYHGGLPLYINVNNSTTLGGNLYDDDDIVRCNSPAFGANSGCGSWSLFLSFNALGAVDAMDRGDARLPQGYPLATAAPN